MTRADNAGFDADLDRAYSPSSMVDDAAPLIAAYAATSAAARAIVAPITLTYGPGPADLVDLFASSPAQSAQSAQSAQTAAENMPLHVFIHGGYWQQLSRLDASFPAPQLTARGVTFAALDYPLAPEATVPEIVDRATAGLRFLHDHVRNARGRRRPMIVSGHSAGAHLAAMAALVDPDLIAGLVLISGIYDLEPLCATSINDAPQMTEEVARSMSPVRLVGGPGSASSPIETLCVVGEIETGAFKQQNATFAAAWERAGHPTEAREVRGRNHFDIVHDVADETSTLGALVRSLEQRVTQRADES